MHSGTQAEAQPRISLNRPSGYRSARGVCRPTWPLVSPE
jgi:hypothetical protein